MDSVALDSLIADDYKGINESQAPAGRALQWLEPVARPQLIYRDAGQRP
jgi:hypothetical protein